MADQWHLHSFKHLNQEVKREGCWMILQAFLGQHQVNIPHRAGWSALHKGAKGTTAPDLWHNLLEEEWQRLKILHVPPKLLRGTGEDMGAWM